MEGSIRDLAVYRMQRAEEMLTASEGNLQIGEYRTSLNRSYYAVFHAIRSLNALDGFDSSKHAGVISHFNQEYMKTGKLDPSLSGIIKNTLYFREKSDYDDFFIVKRSDAESQLINAKKFVADAKCYLESVIDNL